MVRTQLRGSQFFIGTASPPISLAHGLRPMPRQRNLTDPKRAQPHPAGPCHRLAATRVRARYLRPTCPFPRSPTIDPPVGTNWSATGTVSGFAQSAPHAVLMRFTGVEAGVADHLTWAMAPMESIPATDQSFDLIIAHGIWNLAPSVALFR
jgi:hypothetical protein